MLPAVKEYGDDQNAKQAIMFNPNSKELAQSSYRDINESIGKISVQPVN